MQYEDSSFRGPQVSLLNHLQLVLQCFEPPLIICIDISGNRLTSGGITAGKGGVVRRLAWALDPQSFKVHPISAPSSRESRTSIISSFFGKDFRSGASSWCSIAHGTVGYSWSA
jgi:hypothetical protein